MQHKIFRSSDTNVCKFVFEEKDIAVEAVLYRYNSYKERTVICCSTQCGCPVGCAFCGTGKFFVRNLKAEEVVEQVNTALSYIDCDTNEIKKFQIMFMSMGEPFLNYQELQQAIRILHSTYNNAQLLVSTSAPKKMAQCFDAFIELSKEIDKVGIQFSVHESSDQSRKLLIPSATSSLKSIGEFGEKWAMATGRKPFFNYCVHENNSSEENISQLLENFNPAVWECTLSVICEKDSTMKNAIEEKLDLINGFSNKMLSAGYSIRVFNPAGQDDIGGGCGQLWYFQEWLKSKKKVILTLCRVFPVNHSRAGEPTEFETKLKSGEKKHTIRFNAKDVWAERYQDITSGKKYLSVREWTGRPYNSEQRELARYDRIGLQHITMTYGADDAVPQAWVDDKKVPVELLAQNDGLSVQDFVEWFFGNAKSNVFEGVIIHFTDFRY